MCALNISDYIVLARFKSCVRCFGVFITFGLGTIWQGLQLQP